MVSKNQYDLLSHLDIPDLFGVVGNSEEEIMPQLKKFINTDLVVFCVNGVNEVALSYGCGFRVQDGDVSWSVNFSLKDIDQASLIKSEVEEIMKSYREAADAR